MLSAGCIKLRDRRRRHRCPHSQQRALVRSRHQHHRPLSSLLAQRVLHKLPHLSPSLAYQPDDSQICRCIPGHHSNQRALSHTRPAEDTHALSASYRQHSIQHAKSRLQWLSDHLTLHRVWHRPVKRPLLRHPRRRETIQRDPSASTILPSISVPTAIPGVTPIASTASP